MNKTIVIGLPKSFSFHSNLEKNLIALGFTVTNISYIDHDFKYPSFFHKISNFFRKLFLNDKGYKSKLKFKKHASQIQSQLDLSEKFDYALLIRPDIYPPSILKQIRNKTGLMVGYQWDGLHRFPAVYNTIKYFDRFFVFDDKDLTYNSSLRPLTNFYFDYDSKAAHSEIKYDVFFVGSFVRKRMQAISDFATFLAENFLTSKIMIYCQPPALAEEFPNEHIEYFFDHLSYEENIALLKKSRIVVDFLNHAHNGLSFRTFEALFYEKKLITTNSEVSKYDFYNPHNVFIFKENKTSFVDLLEFLKTPYQAVDESVKNKYSFSNWIRYVLNIEPFEKIDLPGR